MSTMPIPANGSLRTPPAIQHEVIARRATGSSKRQIARDLGIARKTVDAVLAGSPVEEPDYATVLHELTTKSFVRVTQAIDTEKDTDTARWALEHTVFRPEQDASLHVHGDATFQAAIGLLPSTTSTPGLTGTDSSTGTEAAAKPALDYTNLSNRTIFFQNLSTAELEAELARRRQCEAITVIAEEAK